MNRRLENMKPGTKPYALAAASYLNTLKDIFGRVQYVQWARNKFLSRPDKRHHHGVSKQKNKGTKKRAYDLFGI